MITYGSGDLLRADTEALVNTVNCVGVMGKELRCSSNAATPRCSPPTKRRANAAKLPSARCSSSTPDSSTDRNTSSTSPPRNTGVHRRSWPISTPASLISSA